MLVYHSKKGGAAQGRPPQIYVFLSEMTSAAGEASGAARQFSISSTLTATQGPLQLFTWAYPPCTWYTVTMEPA